MENEKDLYHIIQLLLKIDKQIKGSPGLAPVFIPDNMKMQRYEFDIFILTNGNKSVQQFYHNDLFFTLSYKYQYISYIHEWYITNIYKWLFLSYDLSVNTFHLVLCPQELSKCFANVFALLYWHHWLIWLSVCPWILIDALFSLCFVLMR